MSPIGFAIAAVAALSGLLIGYDTAVIAGALRFMTDELGLSTTQQQVAAASVLIGALIGAIASGTLAHRFGQRRVLLAAAAIYGICALQFFFVTGFWGLVGWRTVLGLAVGISSMVAPLYVAETAPVHWRGALVSMIQLAITSGILAAYLIGYLFDGQGHWRAMLGWGFAPAIPLFIGLLLLPESPRWLVLNGRIERARIEFERLFGEPWEESELDLIRNAGTQTVGIRALLGPRLRPVLVVAAGLFLLQNLSGIDGILYYAPVIFGFVGFEGSTAQILATAGLGAVNVVATVFAMWLVDRSGRRPLLLTGTAVMSLAMAILAASLSFGGAYQWDNTVAAVALAIYVMAFALSLGPLPYVLMSEVFPLAARSQGMSVAAATAWALNIIVTLTFLTLIELLSIGGTFWLYSGVCLTAFFFAHRMVPETRDRSLEDIEANLDAGLPTRLLGSRLASHDHASTVPH